MPLPLIPVALWVGAAAAGALGLKKGYDAKEMLAQAKAIGSDAQRRHRAVLESLELARGDTQKALEDLGRLKVKVMSEQMKYLVDVLRKGRVRIDGVDAEVTHDELRQYQAMVDSSLELSNGLGSGAVGGALAAMGAYGTVGSLATASTGTLISGLSGAAASNATLAWLGGGALSAGGFGMAGGMVALGGIALGPALAIGGFMLAGKAEEAMTQAVRYRRDVDLAIETMATMKAAMTAIQKNARETKSVIRKIAKLFDDVKVPNRRNAKGFAAMLLVGTKLKEALQIRVLTDGGEADAGVGVQCRGLLEVTGPLVPA